MVGGDSLLLIDCRVFPGYRSRSSAPDVCLILLDAMEEDLQLRPLWSCLR